MKCYHCHENDAEYRFVIHYMDRVGEIHLCDACLERFRRYTEKLFADERESEPAHKDPGEDSRIRGFYRGFASAGARPRAIGEDDFPADAGDAIRRRRQLSELRERLKSAVAREDYETAAALRDEIGRFSFSFTRGE